MHSIIKKLIKHLIIFGLLICACLNAYATTYKVCFTPRENCTQLLVDQINTAHSSIAVQAYSFTAAPIAKALIDAHRRGVKVFVLLDKSNVRQRYSITNTLQNHGIPFLIDWRPAIAHNKIRWLMRIW